MEITQIVPLVASTLATVAPALQVVHILRTRSVQGLSVLTCIALVVGNCLALLIAVQYALGVTIVIMTVSLIIQAVMLHLVTARLSAALWAAILASVALIAFATPGFGKDLLSTRYNEPIAFVWGLIAATTFIPQVLTTRRTRQTEDLSFLTVICFAVGFTLWTVFAWLVQNWSLLLWCAVLTISVYELLRLKLTVRPSPASV